MMLLALFTTSCDKQEPAITQEASLDLGGFDESQFSSEELEAIKNNPDGLKGWIDDQNSHLFKAPDGRYFLNEEQFTKYNKSQEKGNERAQDSYWLTFDSDSYWQTAFYRIYHKGSGGWYLVGLTHSTSFIVMGAPTGGDICNGYNQFYVQHVMINSVKCPPGVVVQYLKNSTLVDQDYHGWKRTQSSGPTWTKWRMYDGGLPASNEDAILIKDCNNSGSMPWCAYIE